MEKIKTCPHCGGSASLRTNYNSNREVYYVFVRCDVCGAQGKLFYTKENPQTAEEDTYCNRGAIAAWNMRKGEVNAEDPADGLQNMP